MAEQDDGRTVALLQETVREPEIQHENGEWGFAGGGWGQN